MNSAEPYEKLPKEDLISIITDQQREIEKLQHHLLQAKKHLFGTKSERLPADARQEALFTFPEPATPESTEVTVPEHRRTIPRGRKPLPELPREEFIHEPAETSCPCCDKPLEEIGRETTEILERIPSRLYIQEHIKVKRACPCCKNAVYSGNLPDGVQPLERSRPGPGLLASIIVSKYCDHLPLHRQEEIFLRDGVIVPRQRMCDWIGEVVKILAPLHDVLLCEILQSPYVQADETPIDVQDRSQENNLAHGYFWAVLKPPNLVYFRYAASRSKDVANALFKDYRGTVQTDLYAGYNEIYLPDTCQRLACLAHVRRKFVEIEKLASKDSQVVLKLIAQIYKIENDIKKLDAEPKLAMRKTRTAKVLGELHKYLTSWHERTLPRSPIVNAIEYALKQWSEIVRVTESPKFEVDNNGIERQIRPIAVGRKNWLFAGSHDGADRAAVLYSLINSCKLNKVNPFEYIRDVIFRAPGASEDELYQLLPHRWTAQVR